MACDGRNAQLDSELFNTLYEPIPCFVRNELENRKNRSYANKPRTAWVRMTSNFNWDDPNGGSQKILMGGDLDPNESMKFGFRSLYESSGTPPNRPIPGITSVNTSEVGSYFTADISWKVWSLDQMDRLMPYFMNPGVTITLEIGWSDMNASAPIDVSNQEEVSKMFWNNLSSEDGIEGSERAAGNNTEHPKFKAMREAGGRYQIFTGLINDFSFSMNQQGGFDCTTSIQNVGEAAYHLSTRLDKKNRSLEEYYPTLEQKLSEKLNWEEEEEGEETDQRQASGQTHEYFLRVGNYKFISWRNIEKLLNEAISLVNPEKNIRLFEFDSRKTQISYPNVDIGNDTKLRVKSTDLSVCLISDQEITRGDFKRIPKFNGKKNGFEVIDDEAGWLDYLLVNAEIFRNAIETNDDVHSAVTWMLDKCSQAVYNIWEFEIVEDNNTLTVYDRNFATAKTTKDYLKSQRTDDRGKGNGLLYEFQPYIKNSNLRDFSFSSNLSEQVKKIIGAKNVGLSNSSADDVENKPILNGFSDAEGLLFNRFKGNDIVLDGLEINDEAGGSEEKTSENQMQSGSGVNKENEDTLLMPEVSEMVEIIEKAGDRKKALSGDVIPENEETLQGFHGYFSTGGEVITVGTALNRQKSQRSPVNANAMLDVDVSFTVTGIAGFRKYQIFQIQHNLSIFQDVGFFLIDEVKHSVQNNDWVTQVRAKYMLINIYKEQSENTELATTSGPRIEPSGSASGPTVQSTPPPSIFGETGRNGGES